MSAILSLKDLRKSYSGVEVLKGVSLTFQPGCIVGLIGENGAGKSTLIRCINGEQPPTAGTLEMDGKILSFRDRRDALNHGVVSVPQEFNLVDTLNVYENIFLGDELLRHGLLDRSAMREAAKKELAKLRCPLDPDRLVGTLSVAEKQFVEIARALRLNCRLLILDEPTTVLNHVETALLFDILRELRDQGVAIVFVSHKLREVKELCDRVAVLRDGVLTGESAMDGVTPELMANWMVGRELSRKFPPMREVDPAAQVLLDIKDLSVAGVLSGISFELHKGEILGVAGLGGSGRSELAEAIYGLRKRTGGSVLLEGNPLGLTAGDAAESGVILLPEDRQGAGVLLDFSVRENISLTWPKVPIDRKYEKERADFYVEKFSIKTPDIETPVRSLSGGNQQKVAIAKGLELHPKVYLFDEPTRGIDVGARSDVYNFLQELASEGIGVLLISSDLEEIIGMCRRTLVMRGGTLAGILTAPDITESAVMALATGIREED